MSKTARRHRVQVNWPFIKDLHRKQGTLKGAEHVDLNGHDLGLLFAVEIDGLGPFWIPRDNLTLLKGERA